MKIKIVDYESIKKTIQGFDKQVKNQFSKLILPRSSIEQIYDYFKFNTKDIRKPPSNEFKNFDEEIDYYFSPFNIHFRKVKLVPGWSRDAIGAMVTTFKKTNESIALIPNNNGRGYHFRDPKTNLIRFIKEINERLFDEEAYLLYRPFKNKKLSFKDFFTFLFSEVTKLEIVEYIIVTLVASLLGIALPYLSKWIITEIGIAQNMNALYSFIVFVSAFMVTGLLFTLFKLFFTNRFVLKMKISLQAAAIGRLISLPPDFFKKYSSGELASRLIYLTQTAEILISSIITTTISVIFSVIYVVQIFSFNTSLAFIAIGITLIMLIFDIIVIHYAEKNIREKIKIDTKESGMSYSLIDGIEKIKVTGSEQSMYNRWFGLYKKSALLTYNPPFILKIRSVVNLLISLTGYLSLYIAAFKSKINVADFYAFSTIYAMAMVYLLSFNNITLNIGRIRPYYEMAKPILEALPEEQTGQIYISSLKGEIKLDHVTFRYDDNGPDVIKDLSLHIKPGEEIAIVGETGCGKSTLVRLLLGFEKAQQGSIYFDKYDINNVDLKSLRHSIGTVMQNTKIFAGDVYSNIVVAAPWKTVNEAWEASKIASLDKDIKEMPMQMKTILQEGENGISGGQRQRLAIARAVVNNPKILIFDEATSALDNITQKKVSDAIKKLKCTRIIIAHRLSTVIHANQIYVLKDGRLDEHGTYKELCDKKGEFTKLMNRQKL